VTNVRPLFIVLLSALYAAVCFWLAFRTVAGPFSSNEWSEPLAGPAGRTSIAVDWPHSTLAKVQFFTATPEALQATPPGEIRVRVESPAGVPIPDIAYGFALDQREALQVFFKPRVRTHGSLVVTVEAPANVVWKNQKRAPHSAVLADGEDPVAAAMIFPRKTGRALAVLGGLGLFAATGLLFFARRQPGFLPALFFLMAGTLLAWSARNMESRLWDWWGAGWPDGYVHYGLALARWLSGSITYMETGLTTFRNGQVWLVPMVLGLLANAGLTPGAAYFLISALSAVLTLGLVARYLWSATGNPTVVAFFLLLAGSSVQIVRVGVNFTTDMPAVFALAAFLVLFLSLLKRPENLSLSAGVTLAAAAGCQIRIALIPLVLVPPAMGGYVIAEALLRHRMDRSVLRKALWIALPGVAAGLLIPATWHVLGVIETFQQARAVSQMDAFRSHFTWARFAAKTAVALFPLVLVSVLVVAERKFLPLRWPSHETIAIAGCIFGLLALLGAGQIIPWHRYWAPVALSSAFLASLWAARLQSNRVLAAAAVGMVAQLAYLVSVGVKI
jgi:hypothetical protein